MPYSHLTNAVISDADAEMIQKPVTVRDGDDLLEVNLPEDDKSNVQEDAGTEDGEKVEVKISTDGDDEAEADGDADSEGDDGEGSSDEELTLPEYQSADPKDLTEAAALMAEAEAGQADLAAKAIEAGLSQESLDKAKAEYEKDGKFSEESYAELAKAGFSKSFIDSYMAGQAAVAERFVKSIYGHVGGEENFTKITAHIAENKPEMAQAFDAAVGRNDVATIRALLDAAVAEVRQSPASKAPKRNLANAAKPAKPAGSKAADKVEGFASRAEMVKAMSDPRYGKDAAFRREVELKVFHSQF
ncbi:capsid assembly scaffolding protein [Aeromonas phage phiA014S]|uniref:Capsid assembly scaffolding protein n=1 Tax=Aeromonas phage phiA014S TaxID=3119845 RepID=A0ABZ2CUP1_9CAUD